MLQHRRVNTRLSHADLLDLYLHQPDNFAQLAEGLGFEKKKRDDNKTLETEKPSTKPIVDPDKLPIDLPVITTVTDRPEIPFFYIVSRERTANHLNPAKQETPLWLNDAEPLTEDAIYDKDAPQPKIPALTRAPKLWGQLRRVLTQSYTTQEPDIDKLVIQIARGETLRAVPFSQSKRRISQVLVLADNAKHLQTTQYDYQQLYQGLIKLWGKEKIHWQSIVDQPLGKVRLYKSRRYVELPWRAPATNTAVIILSDCGSLATRQTRELWQSLLKQLNKSNCLTIVLAPADRQDLQTLSFKGINAFSWDTHLAKTVGAYRKQPDVELSPSRQGAEALLTHLAFSYRIESGLLRAIRLQLGLNVSTEAYCRLHADVIDDGQYLYIKEQALDRYRESFKRLTEKQQNMAIDWVRYFHALQPRSILDQELVNAQQLCEQKIAGATESLHTLQRLVKTFYQQPKWHLLRSWSYNYLQEQQSGKGLAAAVFAALYQEEIEQGKLEILSLPRNVELEDLDAFIDLKQDSQHYRIQQVKDTVQLQALEAGTESGFTILETEFTRTAIKQNNKLISVASGHQLIIDGNKLGMTRSIDTGTENLTLGRLIKPDWASNIGRDKQGLFIEYQQGEKLHRLYYPRFGGAIHKDQYGLYTDLNIKNIILRFRCMAPGTYKMGSPKNEPEREYWGKETQHQVKLTEGFWLAETSVTQALYQAVMGENPSAFKDDQNNPVEQVSWDDAQQFIAQLNTIIPGLQARLPTEAQWEYACRAGSETAFSLGDNITPEQVNYKGDSPYDGAEKGVYREKTVAVKSLPANAWGLYEMHGNVWEWCADGYQEDLGKQSVTDPVVTEVGAKRVLRGGSWDFHGRGVRSAMRSRGQPGERLSVIGLRLSLGLELQHRPVHPDSQQARAEGRREKPDGGQGVGLGDQSVLAKFMNLFTRKP